MRSALIILCTLIVIGVAFAGYLLMQKSAPQHAQSPVLEAPVVRPATAPANPNIPITSGENVFVETYDKNTSQLASRFRAARYDPQPDGSTVNVTGPEAEFHLDGGNGRVIRLRGVDGKVIVPIAPGGAAGGRGQMPSRGTLRDVILMLYPTRAAHKPSLTCRMNNVAFDTDTFRITTEAFVDPKTGSEVPADQVPVEVRGDDYDFDGRGLTIHWDEKDRRLQLLEIAHGQRLVVKHPTGLGTSSSPHARGESRDERPAELADYRSRRETSGNELAPSAGKGEKRARSATTSTTTKPSRTPDPYRAAFHDNVRVMQGDQEVAAADLMNVDFLMNEDEGAAPVSPSPPPVARHSATAPNRRTPSTAHASAPASTTPTSTTQASTAPASTAPASTTQPATQPAAQLPLTVYWTGKLRVTPPPADAEPIAPGDSVVEFVSQSNPVRLHWQGSHVVCAGAQWHTLDDSARLRSSPLVPLVTLDDPRGFTLLTPSMQYSGADRLAITEGKSHAEFPLQRQRPATQPAAPPAATQPADIARVDWSDLCTMKMSPGKMSPGKMSPGKMSPAATSGGGSADLAIEHITLAGDVTVVSSQLKLRSGQLDVVLDPDAQRQHAAAPDANPADADRGAQIAVKQVIATDDVRAAIIDEQNKQQIIDCQRLAADLDRTADGRAYLRVLNADGDVHTSGGDGELSCGHLDATLLPATQPIASAQMPASQPAASQPAGAGDFSQVQIQSLYASHNVRGRTSDGRFIEGDRVTLTQTRDGPQYEIAAIVPAASSAALATTAPTTSETTTAATTEPIAAPATAPTTEPTTTPTNAPTIAPMARVGDGVNTIAGPSIVLTPRIGRADVIGQGSMHGVQQQGATTQPIDLTWKQQLNADMRANQVRIVGDVTATSVLDDGSTNVASGQTLTMELVDAPTTRPAATQPTPPATQPHRAHASTGTAILGGSDFELFGDKIVRTIRLTAPDPQRPVEVRSTLLAADGSLARRINLFAPVLVYEMETRSLVVPAAGRLLHQDNRAATTATAAAASAGTRPTSAPAVVARAATRPIGALGDTSGATAFQWSRDFIYDDAARTATMSGDVQLVHQTAAGAEAYRMSAQRVSAEMQPADPKADPKSAAPDATTKPAGLTAGAKVKRLTADGGIVFNSQRLQFQADHIEFDPVAQQLTARGAGPNAPAVLLDTNGLSQGTFSELHYDTATDQMRLVDFRAAVRR